MTRLFVVIGLIAIAVGMTAPVMTAAQDSTPTASGDTGIMSMLALAPDVMASTDAPETQFFSYADLATQLATIGYSRPSSIDDDDFIRWAYGLESLFMPELYLTNSLSARWKDLIGYDILDIDETMEIGEPPARTLVRGRFDHAAIEAAWANLGYQMVDVDGMTVASLSADASFSIDSEIGRYAFSRFNNAVFLPDGTLAYSPTLDGLREIIAVAQGTSPSLADREDVAALVAAPDQPLVSAMLTSGDFLRYQSLLGPVANQVTPFPEQMPRIKLALFGVTAGGPISRPMTQASPTPGTPNATFEIALLMESDADAARAAEIALDRIENGESWITKRPLSEFFSATESHVLSDPPVTVLSLTFASDAFATFWLRLVLSRDLPFLAWEA